VPIVCCSARSALCSTDWDFDCIATTQTGKISGIVAALGSHYSSRAGALPWSLLGGAPGVVAGAFRGETRADAPLFMARASAKFSPQVRRPVDTFEELRALQGDLAELGTLARIARQDTQKRSVSAPFAFYPFAMSTPLIPARRCAKTDVAAVNRITALPLGWSGTLCTNNLTGLDAGRSPFGEFHDRPALFSLDLN
jgi:hypothetical protein